MFKTISHLDHFLNQWEKVGLEGLKLPEIQYIINPLLSDMDVTGFFHTVKNFHNYTL